MVKAHIVVHSNTDTNTVRKLLNQAKGPFTIIKNLQHAFYAVHRYNHPQFSVHRYKLQDLYLLPPHLFPSEELDTMDVRYLNYSHAPVPSTFRNPLYIELYNDAYFPISEYILINTTNKPSTSLDTLAFQPHASQHPLNISPKIPLPPIPQSIPIPPPLSPTHSTLHKSIIKSTNNIFFVRYTP